MNLKKFEKNSKIKGYVLPVELAADLVALWASSATIAAPSVAYHMDGIFIASPFCLFSPFYVFTKNIIFIYYRWTS